MKIHNNPISTSPLPHPQHGYVILSCSIQVRPVLEESRSQPLAAVCLDAGVTCLRYVDGRMFVGIDTGYVVIYTRDAGECTFLL